VPRRSDPFPDCEICGTRTSDHRSTVCITCYNSRGKLSKNPKFLKGSPEYLEFRKINNEARMRSRLKYQYNFPEESYMAMLESQNYSCAICGVHQDDTKKRLNLDHDHNCCPGESSCGKCIRGLLCSICNSAIGLLKDSEEVIEMALKYLRNTRKVWSK
jgi:hypothetical protein